MKDKIKLNRFLNVFMLVMLLSSIFAQPLYGAAEVASELSSQVSESQEKEAEIEEVDSEEEEEVNSEEEDSEEASEEETNEANAPPIENEEAVSEEAVSEEITTLTDLSSMTNEELEAYFDDETNEVLFIDTTNFELPETFAYSVGVTTSPDDLSVFNSSMWGEFSIYKVNGKYVYCIEPGVNASSSASSTSESGSIYSKFKTATKREIGRIISSSQQHYKDSGNTDWLFAGQMMIWSYLAIHEDALMTHSYGTYNAYASSRYSSEATTIQKELDDWATIPSFMGVSTTKAKAHTLKYNDSTDQFELTLKDTNGVWDSKFADYGDFGSYVVSNPAGANNVKIVSKTAHTSYTSARKYSFKPYATGEALFYDAGQDLAYVGSDPIYGYMKFKTEAMPLGGFRIKKVDSVTGSALSGAEFTLYNDDNNNDKHDSGESKVDTYTTNENGLASSGGKTLPEGNYVLIETKAPEGYVLDKTPHSVTITSNSINDKTATPYKNTLLKGGFRIKKVDSETGEVLAGAEYTLYEDPNNNNTIDSGESKVDTYTTNENGLASSGGKTLTPGNYTIVETKAPEGYVLDNTVHSVTISPGEINDKTATPYKNTLLKGGFKALKVDSETNEALKGAEFDLVDSDGIVVDSFITNKEGEIESGSSDYRPGNYTLVETKAPSGYHLNTTEYPVVIKGGEVNVVNFDTPITNDIIKGGFKALKVDSETNEALKGAEFALKNSTGTTVDSFITNKEGEIESGSSDYRPGNYTLVETKAPNGYHLNTTEYPVVIKGGEVNLVNFDTPITNDVIKGGLKLKKVDVDTGDVLAGAEFDLVDSEGTVVDSFSTNSEGIYTSTLEAYRPGKYTLVETKAPTNYVLPTDNEFDVTIKANEINTVYFDTPIQNEIIKGGFELTKLGEIFQLDNEELEGVEFTVTSTTYPDFNKVYTTDKNGQIITSDDELRFGDYHIEETYAPSKYVIDFEQDFTISEDGLIVMLNGGEDIINKLYLNSVHFTKMAENFNNEDNELYPLEGAKFGIYEEVGKANGTIDRQDHLIDVQTTDSNGEATSIELPEGNYIVKEIEAPEGYNINEDSYPFTITNDGTITNHSVIELGDISNEVITGRAQLIKVGSKLCDKSMSKPDTVKDCQTLLPDVSFGVYQDLNNNDVLDKNESKPVDVMTTDDGGLAVTKELKFGHYFVKELNNPADNYYLNENLFDFTISEQDNLEFINDGVVIENIEKLGNIHITKSGKEIGNLNTDIVALANAEYTIYNSDGEIEDVLTTNSSGEATSTLLSFGDYTIVETSAPEGYVLDETVYPFTIDSDNYEVTQEIEFTDKVITNITEITKVDVASGEELPGANLQIIDSEGGIVDEWISTTDSHKTTVEYGDYTICESFAPEGYAPLGECVKFNVSEDGITQEFKIENELITNEIHIKKIDVATGEEIPGAHLQIIDRNSEDVVDKWVSTEEEHITTVPYGNYAICEQIAPIGYQRKTTCVNFDVTEDGIVQTFKIENELIKEMVITGGDPVKYVATAVLSVVLAISLIGKRMFNKA